jgi:hypothetical protein
VAHCAAGSVSVLDPGEARFGCRIPFRVPSYVGCSTCATDQWWGMCPDCYGRGIVERETELVLEIPPGSRHGEHYEVDLSQDGISNLLLDIRIVVS